MSDLCLDDQEFIVRTMLRILALKRDKKPFGASSIQRQYFMGYNRAARIKEFALEAGIVRESKEHPALIEFNFVEKNKR